MFSMCIYVRFRLSVLSYMRFCLLIQLSAAGKIVMICICSVLITFCFYSCGNTHCFAKVLSEH